MDGKLGKALIGVGVAGLLAVGVTLAMSGSRAAPETTAEKETAAQAARKPARPDAKRLSGRPVRTLPGRGAAAKGMEEKGAKPVLELDDDDDKRTPEERRLAERIEKALDEESFEAAAACAKEALSCKDTEIRQAMVETLGWFGAKALPELTPFLADSDEDVRDGAMNEWSMAVSGIEDDAEKVGVVELAMNVLTDEDALEDISGEYIGVDEKLAVESLMRIIAADGSKNGVAKAKETYEFVTGDEWVSAEAAAKWIAEEYEPPEQK